MTLPSGLPDQVADEEDVARFLTSSGHFNATAVKPAAFMPNPKNGGTSVFRHGAEPLTDLISIGEKEVGGARPVHGAAIIKADTVRKASLELRAGEPPPLHADIIGWPWRLEDLEFGKAEQKLIAALLAQGAGEPLRF
jgi:hypothetical protein